MHWIDIVFIAIIIIFAIIGLVKGLFDSILSLVASIASIFLSFWASKPVAGFLDRVAGTNSFFKKLLVKWNVPAEGALGFSVDQLAALLNIVLSMLIVFILIKVAVWLLAKLFDSVTANSTALSGMNRLFGLIFGALQGFAVVLILLGLTSIASIIPQVGNNVNSFLDKSGMTRHTYNYVNEWVNDELKDKLEDFVRDLVKDEQKPEDNNTNYAEKAKEEVTNESFTVNYTDKSVVVTKIAEKTYENITVKLTYSDIKIKVATAEGEGTDVQDKYTAEIQVNDLTPETAYVLTFTVTYTNFTNTSETASEVITITFTTAAATTPVTPPVGD